MVYACPAESDPRGKVAEFVSDPESRTIAGLRTDGLQFLIDLVRDEVARQDPSAKIVYIDREVLSDNGIDFAQDLARYFGDRLAEGGRWVFLMCDDVPVVGWQSAMRELQGADAQLYCFSVACRQIPSCSKLL